jgi:chromosome segregation ATPase
MMEYDGFNDKYFLAEEELKELQAKEYKANLMVLFKDKEICKLKSQLSDIEEKISMNKKSYSQNNTKSALLHPFVIEEFEYLRRDLQDTHQKINSITMDNFFKKNSESNPPSTLNQLVKFMEKTSIDVSSEVSEGRIESLNSQVDKKKVIIEGLEQKLRENRSYARHLESEISETEDLIIALHAKLVQIDAQCEEIRRENAKLSEKTGPRKRH